MKRIRSWNKSTVKQTLDHSSQNQDSTAVYTKRHEKYLNMHTVEENII